MGDQRERQVELAQTNFKYGWFSQCWFSNLYWVFYDLFLLCNSFSYTIKNMWKYINKNKYSFPNLHYCIFIIFFNISKTDFCTAWVKGMSKPKWIVKNASGWNIIIYPIFQKIVSLDHILNSLYNGSEFLSLKATLL